MKCKAIHTGGQTGVDKTALVEAKLRGLKTGGWAIRDFTTEAGVDLELRDVYGLKDCGARDPAVRTWSNVQDCDATVWFGHTNTPGYRSTKNAAKCYGKTFYENPTPELFLYYLHSYELINIAGNRLSKNANGPALVRKAFSLIELPKQEAGDGNTTDANI